MKRVINKIIDIFRTPKLNYTVTAGLVQVLPNGNNSGNDIIMPTLSPQIWKDIIKRNELFETRGFNKDDEYDRYTRTYKSKKYPETYVKVDKNDNVFFSGRLFISTYVRLDIPKGYDFDIRNRSGNFNKNIFVVCGLIDEPYTGEMGLQLISVTDEEYAHLKFSTVEQQISYAQIVMHKNEDLKLNFLSVFNFKRLSSVKIKNDIRGDKGFGSTGK